MSKTFKNVVLCHTNDFPDDQNNKIKGWVEGNGGKFSKDVTTEVTHLVTSMRAWKRYHPLGMECYGTNSRKLTSQVQLARRLRTVHIVNYDWLEDSLTRARKTPLFEGPYSYEKSSVEKIKKRRKLAGARRGQRTKSPRVTERGAAGVVSEPNTSSRVPCAPSGTDNAFDKACLKMERDMATGMSAICQYT